LCREPAAVVFSVVRIRPLVRVPRGGSVDPAILVAAAVAVDVILMALAGFAFASVAAGTHSPFIYFRF
jgi:hypothetical protein